MSEDITDRPHVHREDDVIDYILPAEQMGLADTVTINGVQYIHVGGVMIPWLQERAYVYVRRYSSDLTIAEIHLAHHSGIYGEVMGEEDRQAAMYPLGRKEYFRSKWVGSMYDDDGNEMDDAAFEVFWAELESDDDEDGDA